jgi:hypothetical protein
VRPFAPTILLLCALAGRAQTVTPLASATPQPDAQQTQPQSLPDAPSVVASQQDIQPDAQQQDIIVVAETSFKTTGNSYRPCNLPDAMRMFHLRAGDDWRARHPCAEIFNPYQRFLNTTLPIPLSPKQKGFLAIHNLTDPFNFATIIATSGITVAVDSHTAYGPGIGGFATSAGVSLLQDATGEFFGTFAIPSIAHEDPHYHRMAHGSIPRRTLHAISRTVIAQSDTGHNMPNYATLLTYPIGAELGNLYVPGIQSDGRSTALRIMTGYALDPANNLVTEFLPDVAKRIHIRIIFVQQILNQVAATQTTSTF